MHVLNSVKDTGVLKGPVRITGAQTACWEIYNVRS